MFQPTYKRRLPVLAGLVALGLTAGGYAAASANAAGAQVATITAAKALTSMDYANISDESPLFKVIGSDAVKDGPVVGASVKEYDNKEDGPTALANARLMVQDHPQVIADWNALSGLNVSLGAIFSRARIPCIAVNLQINGCAFFNLSNALQGVQGAHIITPLAKKRGWNGSNTTILMVQAAADGTEVNDSVRYFYVTLSHTLSGFKRVTPKSITALTTIIGAHNGDQIEGQGTLQGTETAVRDYLQTIPANHNVMIFTINDDSGLGAWRAVQIAHHQAHTMLISAGADPDAIKMLRTNPDWVAEGAIFLDYWPQYLLAMAKAMLDGVKPPALTASPQLMLSKQTVNKYYKGTTLTHGAPLPKADQYLVRTGILQKFGDTPGL